MTINTQPFPMEGGCACGFIRYRMENPPLIVHCCHCTSCQRETGTAFALNAIIESCYVTSLPSSAPMVPASVRSPAKEAGPGISTSTETGKELEIILTPSESKKGQKVARCPQCWVAVWSFYGAAGLQRRFIRVGTLDEAWKVGPDVHIYTHSKREFVKLEEGVPQYPEFYPLKDVWSKESLERWERAP